jgi:hypothetical protein
MRRPSQSSNLSMSNNVVVLALSDAVAGALGALASTALCYPLDHAKVQVQARSHSREASDEEEAGVDESQAQVEKETLLRSRTIAQLMRMLKEGGVRRVCTEAWKCFFAAAAAAAACHFH